MKYDKKFYETRHLNTKYSATKILNLIHNHYKFESATDFGCGTGTWLSVCKSFGAKVIKGFDGPWVPKQFLNINKDEFQEINFEKDQIHNQKYDLAISLEVAEHLSPNLAKKFIKNLCNSAPLVVFSAAIPFQGGNGHINEQWLNYWTELFKNENYYLVDFIRPKIWNDNKIPFWYKQNILVFVDSKNESLLAKLKCLDSFNGINLVHPELYTIKANPSTISRAKLLLNTPKYLMDKFIR